VKLDLVSDASGRNMEKALRQAYWLGFEDAKKLRKRGSKVRALRTGDQIAKEICLRCRRPHVAHLRSSYGAGLLQG